MPNVATVLKAETTRIARKEITSEVKPLRKLQSQHRSAIAALKRRIDQLEKQLREVAKSAARATAAAGGGGAGRGRSNGQKRGEDGSAAESGAGGRKLRFRAAGLAAHRQRLGLSAAAAGELMGVSGLTVYKWEGGKTRPRASQLQSIAAFRRLGKREAQKRLEQLA
jgi:DNA-binding XRE family transcriptional regulator